MKAVGVGSAASYAKSTLKVSTLEQIEIVQVIA
jgi:hypothetical protein